MKEPKILQRIKKARTPRKRKQLTYIAILPSLVTLMNGLCGFTAIVLSSREMGEVWRPLLFPKISMSFFTLAGYMIFLGMVADVLDGHVARMSKSTSSFGAQLDSLCDVISFGVAPAFIMLKLVEMHAHQLQFENERLTVLFGRAVYLIAIIYTLCAIIRLARFNAENKEDESAHLEFAGLPSPPAAGLIVSMIIFTEWCAGSFPNIDLYAIWILPAVTLLAGLLMVTRIPYPHLANRILRGKKKFSTFLFIALTLLLTIWNIQLAMVLGFTIFALYGLVRWLIAAILKTKEPETAKPT